MRATVILSVLTLAAVAHADERPRSFGVGPTVGKTHGMGVFARARFGRLGFDVGGGAMPVLFQVQKEAGEPPEFAFDLAAQAAGSLLFFFGDDPARKYHHGLRAGALWNSLLGAGGMLGYQAEIAFGDTWAFTFGGGLQYLPNAKEGAQELVEEKYDDADSVELEESLLVVQPYLSVGLLAYFN